MEETSIYELPMVTVDDDARWRTALVFGDYLLASGLNPERVCARQPSEKNAHKHFTIIQIEMDAHHNITKAVANCNYHQLEVVAITKELAEVGVVVHMGEELMQRLVSREGIVELVLSRSKTESGSFLFFIDAIKEDGGLGSLLGTYADDLSGYQKALRHLISAASEYNVPYQNKVAAKVFAGQKLEVSSDSTT